MPGLLALAASGLLAAGAAGSQSAVSSNLNAGFDADGNIYLTFADGSKIGAPTAPGTVIPAGTYSINLDNNGIDDAGNSHEFSLSGPGVNLSAGTNLYATATWSATFQPASTYVFQDALNPTAIHEVFGTPGSGAGSVTTTATTPPPSAPTSSKSPTSNNIVGTAVVPLRGTLVGSVSAAGKLTLTLKGKNVSSLKAGRYTFQITDSSKSGGFTVQAIHTSATTLTAPSFVGKRSVTLNLKAGQWFFYPSFVGQKTYFIVVA